MEDLSVQMGAKYSVPRRTRKRAEEPTSRSEHFAAGSSQFPHPKRVHDDIGQVRRYGK